MRTWQEHEVAQLLEPAHSSRYYSFFSLALGTGMRLGEVLGCQWRDVDWDAGKIHVQRSCTHGMKGYVFQQPNTKQGNRTIKLAPSTLLDLSEHLCVQQAERQAAGDVCNDRSLIVTTCTGNPVLLHNILTTFNRLISQGGLPKSRIHDLRHTHAALMLKKVSIPRLCRNVLVKRVSPLPSIFTVTFCSQCKMRQQKKSIRV
jgi:integrase